MIKKVGIGIIMVILLVVAYNMIHQIVQATKAGDRLEQEISQLKGLEIKNKDLRDQLRQVKSLEFIELQARDKLGLVKDGETMVVIPEDKINQVLGLNKKLEEVKLPNWLGWLNLFLK